MEVSKVLVLGALITITVATPIPDSSRIVNGTDAKLGQIPIIVSLRIYGSHGCAGSILDETHVLTASHCVDGTPASNLEIQYGVIDIESNENVIGVKQYFQHEQYDPNNYWANDVAVLVLISPIVLGENVKVATLPLQGEVPPANKTAVVAGWGLDQTGGSVQRFLKVVDIILFSDDFCRLTLGSTVNFVHHVCAGVPEGGKGECNGDSGGPLTVDGVVQGSVSWSFKPCTIKGYPGVYARVASYVDWINDKRQY